VADWTTCPACQLRHSRRPDGLCPRCKQSVDAGDAPTLPVEATPTAGAAAPLAPLSSSAAQLGSLAQAARGKELRTARVIMWFIGVMTLAINAFFFSTAAADVQKEIDKEIAKLQPGLVVDQAKVEQIKGEAVRTARLVNGGGILLGAVFIACGILVRRHPVPATITALALYLGGTAIFGMINPSSLAAGFIVKILIVVGLFKAVQAAIAFRREQTAAADA
jgi:hypothetical protein